MAFWRPRMPAIRVSTAAYTFSSTRGTVANIVGRTSAICCMRNSCDVKYTDDPW